MTQRTALLNGPTKNLDHDWTALSRALTNGGVYDGLELTNISGDDYRVSPGFALIKGLKTNGKIAIHHYESDANHDFTLAGDFKVWIELPQANLDNPLENSADGTGIGAITTGANYPSSNYVPIASVVGGVITDERDFSLIDYMKKTGNVAETINGLKTFAIAPRVSDVDDDPDNDADLIHKKYLDAQLALAGAISRLTALRVCGETLKNGEPYFIGGGGATEDNLGTALNFTCGDTAGTQTRYVQIKTNATYDVLRQIRDMRINTQGSPTGLDCFAVLDDGTEVQIYRVTRASGAFTNNALTFGADFDMQYIDRKVTQLKFVAAAADANNYYRIQVVEIAGQNEIDTSETEIDSEVFDSSVWTEFASITVASLTSITEIDFEFLSNYAYYYDDMDWRVKKNGTVIDGPNNSGLPSNTSGRYDVGKTGLSYTVAPGDVITLELMNPSNLNSGYPYTVKNFNITGDGYVLRGSYDRGYEADKKYLSLDTGPRALCMGICLEDGVEDEQKNGVEAGLHEMPSVLEGTIYVDSDGGLSTTESDCYVGYGKGDLLDVKRVVPVVLPYTVVLKPGATTLMSDNTTETSTETGINYAVIKSFTFDVGKFEGSMGCPFEFFNANYGTNYHVKAFIDGVEFYSFNLFSSSQDDIRHSVSPSFNVTPGEHTVEIRGNYSMQVRNASINYDVGLDTDQVVAL